MKFPHYITIMAGEIGASLISSGAQIANTLINQAFAEHNRERNFYWNEKAADAADQRQRKQYHELYSPEGMMSQYAAAGLSPSMMMSGGQSATGQSTAQGNQSAGLQGPYPQGNIIDPLAAAQIANINANTKKTEAETSNIESDTELNFNKLANIAADTGNKKLQNQFIQLQIRFQQLQNEFQESANTVQFGSEPYQIQQAIHQAALIFGTSNGIMLDNIDKEWRNKFTAETYATRVKAFTQQYNNSVIQFAKSVADITLTLEQADAISEQLAIAWYNADTSRMSQEAQQKLFEDQVEQWCKQNGYTEQQIKNEKVRNWTTFAANIFGSLCNVGSSALRMLGDAVPL